MKQIPAIIGWLLIGTAFAFFIYGVWDAAWLSFHSAGRSDVLLPEPVELMLTTISAILLTNFGAVLGFTISVPNSSLARKILPGRDLVKAIPPPMTSREQVQFVALILYILTLIACEVIWAMKGFTTKSTEIAAFIPQAGRTFFAVIASYLAFILGAKPTN